MMDKFKVEFFLKPIKGEPSYTWKDEVYLYLPGSLSNSEIILIGMAQIHSYPKSLGAMVYVLNDNLNYVERKEIEKSEEYLKVSRSTFYDLCNLSAILINYDGCRTAPELMNLIDGTRSILDKTLIEIKDLEEKNQ